MESYEERIKADLGDQIDQLQEEVDRLERAVATARGEGMGIGAAAEGARIRRELLALIDDGNSGIYRRWDGYSYIEYAPLRVAIDGIIPPEAP